jgi:hypothetical protein
LSKEKRELLVLSLRKYGLLSPIYVTRKGLILSGHQRTSVLKSLGNTEVYVNYVDDMDSKSFTNAVNFMFNKELQEILNDEEFDENKVTELKIFLEGKEDVKDIYEPLRGMSLMNYEDIIVDRECNIGDSQNSRLLYQKCKVVIPVILNEKNELVNGRGRLEFYNSKFRQIPVIKVKDLSNDIFRYITANYSVKGKEDNIRVEQRRHFVQYTVGVATKVMIMGRIAEKANSLMYANFLKRKYPNYLEFGSGNAKQSAFLRTKGVNLTLFEPFVQGKESGVSIAQTYDSINNFLDKVAENKPFDLVNAMAVFNSVPFETDRVKVATLLKFLSSGGKTLLVSSRNKKAFEIYRTRRGTSTATSIKESEADRGDTFITIAQKTKVQTFHSLEDLAFYVNPEGLQQNTLENLTYIFLKVTDPLYRISYKELMEAVDMEFNFKYYDRHFEDLHLKARAVFKERYKIFKDKGLIL